jgi:Arc/MetJ family transcription regulator
MHVACTIGVARSRTNIEIEDSYLQLIMERYGVRTKTEAVDLHAGGRGLAA